MKDQTIAASALLAAVAAGSVYLYANSKYEKVAVLPSPTAPSVLAYATPECLAAVSSTGAKSCAKCETGRWDGKARVTVSGWCCGDLFMPATVQACLDAAKVLADTPPPYAGLGGGAGAMAPEEK